jgi:hypothetical protein
VEYVVGYQDSFIKPESDSEDSSSEESYEVETDSDSDSSGGGGKLEPVIALFNSFPRVLAGISLI